MDAGPIATSFADRSRYALILSYADVSLMATIFYDYLTYLGEEVELIWNRKFTFTSTLYILMRYLGIVFVIFLCLYRLPVSILALPCETFDVATTAFKAILAPLVQGLMALRVHILYEECMPIAVLLFVSFVVSQATALTGLFLILKQEAASYRSFDEHYCSIAQFDTNSQQWIRTLNVALVIPFEILICALALFSWFTRHRSTRRRLTQWSVNDILTTMMRDNIIYFVIALICMCLSSEWALPQSTADEPRQFTLGAAWYMSLLDASQVVMFSLCGPHMILSIRRYCVADSPVAQRTAVTSSPQQFTSVPLYDLGTETFGDVYTVSSTWGGYSRSFTRVGDA